MVVTSHLKTAVGAMSYSSLFQFMYRWKQMFINFGFDHPTSGQSLNPAPIKGTGPISSGFGNHWLL
jgi:hypothetical protein